MSVRRVLPVTVFFLLFAGFAYAMPLTGIGYGKTEDEAKKEALADLSSTIKVQVYSKYEQTTRSRGSEASVESSRFTRLVSNVPLINPEIIYSKENKTIKAVAVINNPESYVARVANIASEIDSAVKFPENSGRDAIYRQLQSVMTLYDEYESYQTVLIVLGVSGYKTPKISGGEARAMLLDMQSTPPSLEIAAEVLAAPVVDEKSIYVSAPLTPGSDEVTPFAAFFRELLSAKIRSVKSADVADYRFNCVYSPSGGDMIMSCSLLSNAGSVVKSSIVKIPSALIQGNVFKPSSADVMSIINKFDSGKSELKVSIKISADGDPSMLRAGESCTILVKANKPSYVYVLGYSRTVAGDYASVLLLGINGAFIKPIPEKDVGKWVSLGRFIVTESVGTETLQVFAMTETPIPPKILPDYAVDNFGPLKVRPEVAAEDFLYLFSRQKGEKNISSLTYTIIGGRK